MILNQGGNVERLLSIPDVLDILKRELPQLMATDERFVVKVHGKGRDLSLHIERSRIIDSRPGLKPLEERR